MQMPSSILVDRRNILQVRELILEDMQASGLKGLDIETTNRFAHEGILKLESKKTIFDIRRTVITGLSVYADGADRWARDLTAAGVPCGPINGLDDAFALATSLDLSPVVEVPGSGVPQVANPLRMSATPPSYRLGPPPLEG